MFSEKELNEFINKMFDNAVKSNNSEAKEGLQTFRKYLEETHMCSNDYLKKIDKIIECSSELIALKRKAGITDVTSIVITENEKKAKQKTIGTYPTSSSCMNSTPSYSDSCSGGSRYTRRC